MGDGLIHMGCKQKLLPNGNYEKKMIPIKLCRTCRKERKARPASFKKAEGPQHFYFLEYTQKEHESDDHIDEKVPGRRRLTNQALIDRFNRESVRCQES